MKIPKQMMVEPRPTAAQLRARQDDEVWDKIAELAVEQGILEHTGERKWSEKLGRWEKVFRKI